MTEVGFPVGYHRFHKRRLFNFQLNRPYAFGYARFEDLKKAGGNITSFKDWKTVLIRLADEAVSENRLTNAAFYYRAAEFYTRSTDPEKTTLYNKFTDLFYEAIRDDAIARHNIRFEDGFLPALEIPPAHENKGTIVVHGGFDSFIEELYSMMKYFSNHGYHVIGFEGPGQGAALRKSGLALTYEWEKATKVILDHFNLKNITLLGLSMGDGFASGLRLLSRASRMSLLQDTPSIT